MNYNEALGYGISRLKKFKITTKGNRGSNLTNEDMTEPGEKSYDNNPYSKYSSS